MTARFPFAQASAFGSEGQGVWLQRRIAWKLAAGAGFGHYDPGVQGFQKIYRRSLAVVSAGLLPLDPAHGDVAILPGAITPLDPEDFSCAYLPVFYAGLLSYSPLALRSVRQSLRRNR